MPRSTSALEAPPAVCTAEESCFRVRQKENRGIRRGRNSLPKFHRGPTGDMKAVTTALEAVRVCLYIPIEVPCGSRGKKARKFRARGGKFV